MDYNFTFNKKKTNIVLCITLLLLLIGCTSKPKEGVWLYQLPNQSYSQMMSYIISDAKGDLIVIDGGTGDDMQYLVDEILKINNEGIVKGWFLTHYHKDHTGALAKYLLSNSKSLVIENIYYQFPDNDWVYKNEPSRYEDFKVIEEALNGQNANVVKKEDLMNFSDFSVEVLRNFDNMITVNAGNNSSIVYKVKTEESDLLFLGDLGIESGDTMLRDSREQVSNMDYVQMAHHGQAGVNEEFYQVVNPKYCLWPTPSWLWDNDNKSYQTDETKEWMKKLHVQKNYIAKDGLCEIRVSQ